MDLPYAHIFPVFTPNDAPSLVDGAEALQSVKHRDGSGLAFTSIAFPSPKPRNDPGRPCQRFEGVWVSLFSGLALKGGLQVSQDFDFLLVKGIGGWTRRFVGEWTCILEAAAGRCGGADGPLALAGVLKREKGKRVIEASHSPSLRQKSSINPDPLTTQPS